MDRRTFIGSAAFFAAAPAIVRYSSLMPVKAFAPAGVCELADMLYKAMDAWAWSVRNGYLEPDAFASLTAVPNIRLPT